MFRISLNNLLLFVYFFSAPFFFTFYPFSLFLQTKKKCFIFCFDILHAICFCYRSSKIVVVNPVRCVRRDDIHPPHFYYVQDLPVQSVFCLHFNGQSRPLSPQFFFFYFDFFNKKKSSNQYQY